MAKSSVVILQSCFMVFIFALTFISGLLPILLPWFKKHPILISITNAFSGGIFLSLAITHLLPETSEKYEEWKGEEEHDEHEEEGHEEEEHAHDHGFNLAFTLVFVGYAFILLVDKVLFDTHSLHGDHQHDGQSKPNASASQSLSKKHPDNVYVGDVEPARVPDDEEERVDRNHVFVSKMSGILQEDSKSPEHNESKQSQNGNKVKDIGDIENTDEKMEPSTDASETKFDNMKLFSLAAVTLMLGLSAHSLFEGIVVGLEEHSREVWSLILAIGSHKWAAGLSLGISLHKSFEGKNLIIVVLLIVFSLSTPIGVFIGMLVSGESDITEVVFNALAAGTFIYVAASEVIAEEFSKPKYKWYKMGFFLIGAGFIIGINEIDF